MCAVLALLAVIAWPAAASGRASVPSGIGNIWPAIAAAGSAPHTATDPNTPVLVSDPDKSPHGYRLTGHRSGSAGTTRGAG